MPSGWVATGLSRKSFVISQEPERRLGVQSIASYRPPVDSLSADVKRKTFRLAALSLALCLPSPGEPLLSSWFTELSGRYARIYPDNAAMVSGSSVTTWSRGQGNQVQPVYAGVTEVSSTETDVYIRTSNLGFHVMGPWYAANGNLFPNYPANRAEIYRFPKIPDIPSSKTPTGLGVIGYMVDGIALFDSRDAFSYDASEEVDDGPRAPAQVQGDGVWNRDAYVNEGVTFDGALAHQAGSNHHYHANAPAIRHFLGDSVDYVASSNTYVESPNGTHSPIMGWFRDGLPLYGPYGYSSPMNPDSGVRRMVSGYQPRDGSNGSADLAVSSGNMLSGTATGRTSLPLWVSRNSGRDSSLTAAEYGPPVSGNFPIGHYLEDYGYKGDLGLTLYQGRGNFDSDRHFDLNEYNVRYCVTPDYPDGTWAYFTNISSEGTPVFPYNIGRYYFGSPEGSSPTTVPDSAVVHFEGGPRKSPIIASVDHAASGALVLEWSVVEGGRYVVETTTSLAVGSWVAEALNQQPEGEMLSYRSGDPSEVSSPRKRFFRSRLTELEPFDTNGLEDFDFTPSVVHVFQFPVSPPLPANIGVLTVGEAGAEVIAYDPSTGLVEASFDDSNFQEGEYLARINGSLASLNTYRVAGANNVLLLILDDWGIDASELYNTRRPGIQLATMPNLRTLLYSSGEITGTPDAGLLFTRGYAQPICSPTRATILTGRQTYQHGVGNPSPDNILPASEETFPEIISRAAPAYGLASFGKWHLGSGNTGPRERGGWPNFSGTLQGGVQDYNSWNRVKIEEGALVDPGTAITTLVADGLYSSPYATSVQVDEAVSFVEGRGSSPWVLWMGFNAPHDPFHDPPADLAPAGGFSTSGVSNRDSYVRMLEALDTEIGRLLSSVDRDRTNIIVVGDNGTPNQVDQAPAGGLAGAKGSLNEGGIHVPFFATGPDVLQTGFSDALVQVADLFTTILDLTGVDTAGETAHLELHSTSLVPIFEGVDTAERLIIAEKWGLNARDGRSLILDDWPQYKLVSIQDVTDPEDEATYQMYLIGEAGVEIEALTTPPNAGDPHEAAYNALVAIDEELAPAPVSTVTFQIALPPTGISTNGRTANLPALVNAANGNIVRPIGITIGGEAASWDNGDITLNGVTTSAARVDGNGNPDPASVVAAFDIANSGLVTGESYSVEVVFRGGGGASRVFTAINQFVMP